MSSEVRARNIAFSKLSKLVPIHGLSQWKISHCMELSNNNT